jgi:TonB family protein
MSAADMPSSPGSARGAPGSPTSALRLYEPTWWERRFPWLLAALAALDPAPLGRSLAFLTVPARFVLEGLSRPLAAVLDTVGRALDGLWRGCTRALGAAVAALPLPAFVRRSLWLPVGVEDAYPIGAQAALRRQHTVVVPLALMAAVGAHAGILVYAPMFDVANVASASETLAAIELPPEVQIPPPPQPLARPAAPVIASADVDEDITIAPTTFDDYDVTDLPPPPVQAVSDDRRVPAFTPFTVAPRILNTDLIEELMATEYPPLLREVGIGGTVVVWAYITRDGIVEEVQVAQSSGYEPLDEAGLRVAERVRLSPALNRDVTVPVWIQLPLQFEVR